MVAKKLNAAQRIKKAQRDNEQWVLAAAKRKASDGGALNYGHLTVAGMNALGRLEAKGLLSYSKTRFGYVPTKQGWRRPLRVPGVR
jgi:hypothetical protein